MESNPALTVGERIGMQRGNLSSVVTQMETTELDPKHASDYSAISPHHHGTTPICFLLFHQDHSLCNTNVSSGIQRTNVSAKSCHLLPPPSPVFTWTCGKDYVRTPAWGWEVWDKEPSPLTGRLCQVRKAARFPLLSKLCQRKRREMDNQTTVHVMHILQTENQGMEVRLKGSQNSNTGFLIPTVVLFPLWQFAPSVIATCSGKQTHSEGQCR